MNVCDANFLLYKPPEVVGEGAITAQLRINALLQS